MTNPPYANAIQTIVGADRHPSEHLGRAVSSEQIVHILHSEQCRQLHDGGERDLSDCPYSVTLEAIGIRDEDWDGYQDQPVGLSIETGRLTPTPLPPRKPSYVYVASSWRNPLQPAIIHVLRAAGIDCYDFRNPAPGVEGFSWSEIDPDWQNWTAEQYVKALAHPVAIDGYRHDFDAMQKADAFVLILPCGRSAHLELGWAVGAGKRTAILTRDGEEPELMAKMVDHIATSLVDLLGWLGVED